MAQITIQLPTMQHWRTTLFGLITAAGGAIVQYWRNGGPSRRECAIAATGAGACYLMADGQGAATKEQLAGAVSSLTPKGNITAKTTITSKEVPVGTVVDTKPIAYWNSKTKQYVSQVTMVI